MCVYIVSHELDFADTRWGGCNLRKKVCNLDNIDDCYFPVVSFISIFSFVLMVT